MAAGFSLCKRALALRCPDGKGPDGKGILYMEEPPDADTDDGDWVPDWTPKFNIGNKTADIYSPNVLYSPTTVGSGRNTRLWVIMEQTTTMTIYEKLELVYFPYDNQDLTILLDCTLGLDKFELIPFSQNNGKPLDHGRVLHTVGMVPDVLKPGYLNDFGFPGKPFTYEFQHVKTANMHSSALKVPPARRTRPPPPAMARQALGRCLMQECRKEERRARDPPPTQLAQPHHSSSRPRRRQTLDRSPSSSSASRHSTC